MSLTLVRSTDNRTLWQTCVRRFLDELGGGTGPERHPSHVWLTSRLLRDALLERAFEQGAAGWLAPPISFLSDLPERLGVRATPIGLLGRRRIVTELARTNGERFRIGISRDRGVVRGHMIDSLLGELLPEGITSDALRAALDAVDGGDDDFARRRADWIVAVHRDYGEALAERGLFDPRAINALLANAIDGGGLRIAVHRADRLHIYGIESTRSRHRLIRALAAQTDVEVALYAPLEDEPNEWDELAVLLGLSTERIEPGDEGRAAPAAADAATARGRRTKSMPRDQLAFDLTAPETPGATPAPDGNVDGSAATPTASIRVQPAPDAQREYAWIAAEVKHRLVAGGIEPHEIAVIARTGREDTRRACDALVAAGVPISARLRMPLAEIGVLRALLELFRGAAEGWTWRALRNVLASPYFDARVDLRAIDFIARRRRVEGLDEWADELDRLARAVDDNEDRDVWRFGVPADRLRDDAARLRALAEELGGLVGRRGEREWVTLTLGLLAGEGVLGMRRRACRVVGDRWHIVRFDQRGVLQLESLLREWVELDLPESTIDTPAWHRLLERLLQAHELTLSTPAQKGVQVLEAHDVALVPFRVVFLSHANDGEFPKAVSPGGILLEEERAPLRAAGLPLAGIDDVMRRERTLWRAAVQAPEVTITYRTTDPAGRPLLPSLMVPPHDAATELPRSFEPTGEAVSVEHALRASAVALRSSPTDLVETIDAMALRRAVVAAHGEAMRGVRDRAGDGVRSPNPWNGELRDPAVLEHIARRYDAEYRWSASHLERYSACPFLYLVGDVLRLATTEQASEDATPLIVGSIAHELLQRFYEEVLSAVPRELDGPALAVYERIADEVFTRRENGSEWLGLPVLWRHKREDIRATVRAYLTWELQYMPTARERPFRCEVVLDSPAGEFIEIAHEDVSDTSRMMRVAGRVDRVDLYETTQSHTYRVLDYKSTNPSKGGYDDGTLIQAPLYMLAIERCLGGIVDRARYRSFRKPGDPRNSAEMRPGTSGFQTALRIAFSIPGRVHAGLFEPVMAAKADWKFYHPGIEVTRTRAKLSAGTRFDG